MSNFCDKFVISTGAPHWKDDKFDKQLAEFLGENGHFLRQICHLDRSVAKWRDLRFLSLEQGLRDSLASGADYRADHPVALAQDVQLAFSIHAEADIGAPSGNNGQPR
jgi:hypothetical protein